MVHLFKQDAFTLQSFFSLAGRGFYIPPYQREYSWDDENANELMRDIILGTKRVLKKSNNTIFLGTVILHDETDVKVHTHIDTPSIISKISTVVDGQQRISSIALLACVIDDTITAIVEQIEKLQSKSTELQNVRLELENTKIELRDFYSVEVKMPGAEPPIKPIIIRARGTQTHPITDQWTHKGNHEDFYQSNVSSFLANYIAGGSIQNITSDERIASVVTVFNNSIKEELENVVEDEINDLLKANSDRAGNLHKFRSYPPNMPDLKLLVENEKNACYQGILLLALCSFFKRSCNLVVIECFDVDLALDMFQSLNATGTPLTAFEVFKPKLISDWGANYPLIESYVGRIETVLRSERKSIAKSEVTDAIIVSSALVFNGDIVGKHFSQERDWLNDTHYETKSSVPGPSDIGLIKCLADQAEYFQIFQQQKKPAKNETTFSLINKLMNLGLDAQQADVSALCVYYLKDAKHTFANSIISVFYSKLLDAQGDNYKVLKAASEFHSVCKATAAFFTLWMGSLKNRFPDAVYRDLFQNGSANLSFHGGPANQNADFVKTKFRQELAVKSVYDVGDETNSKTLWVQNAKENPWYMKKSVCRFALLVANNDAAPDPAPGGEGLLIDGKSKSAEVLNCRSWFSEDYSVIEHVATRDEPKNIKFPAKHDPTIYPGNYSIVDKIGNLTLLPRKVNSSTYSEWPDKIYFYWSITKPDSVAISSSAEDLKKALSLSSVPPALASLSASSEYLPLLAPLAYRGTKGLDWNELFIKTRSEHLCKRVFDKLDKWLK